MDRPRRGDPDLGPAEAAVAGLASNLDQLRGREAAAFAGRQPLVKLDSTQLLERVDHGLLIRAHDQGNQSDFYDKRLAEGKKTFF